MHARFGKIALIAGLLGLAPVSAGAEEAESLDLAFEDVLPGGGVASAGVGLSTTRGGGDGTGTIALSGIPAGAEVHRALLYWSSYAGPRDFVLFEDDVVLGAHIGFAGDTCWYFGASSAYRADVTSMVGGNGSYAITDPGGHGQGDLAGASLVVSYFDPTVDTSTLIQVLDGLISTNNQIFETLSISFPLALEDDPISLALHVGFGDGVPYVQDGDDQGGGEGPLLVNGVEVLPENSIEGSAGPYWDAHSVEIPDGAITQASPAVVSINNGLDCFTWNYAVLEVELPDRFGPFVRGVPDRAPTPHGWYDDPVTIRWEAFDANGATQPADTIAGTEGRDVVYTSEPSCDLLGNCATGSISLSIDLGMPDTYVPPLELPLVGDAPVDVVSLFDGGAYGYATDALSGVDTVHVDLIGVDGTARRVELDWFWCETEDAYHCNFGAEYPKPDFIVERVRIAAVDRAGNVDDTPIARVLVRPSDPFQDCPAPGLPMCEWDHPLEPVCGLGVEIFLCE